MPKVSIIMPTYNVEKYFRQCLDSVVNQTLQDIEIIPVDDGSPDNCGAIMDEYAKNDKRIKPIHQPNGGYGKAVNAGINAATGEYIGIVETDDWCELNMFEKLYTQAKKMDADVCKCDFNYYYGKGRFVPYNKIKDVAPENSLFTLKENPLIMMHHVSIWSSIYRKDFLDKHNIRVEESRSASYQDMPFASLVYAKGAKITLLHEPLINYRAEDDMNSSTIRTDGRLKMMPIMCEIAKQYFIENNCWEEVKEVAYKHFYHSSFIMWTQTEDKYKKAHFDELYKLFKNIPEENVQLIYFNKRQKKVINLIVNNNFIKLLNNPHLWHENSKLKNIRRKILQIRWNKKEHLIKIMNKIYYKKSFQ